jgi:hypothetical protein
MADSTSTFGFDPASIAAMNAFSEALRKVDAAFTSKFSGNASGGDFGTSFSSSDHELDTRHKRSELDHFKDFKDYNKTFKPYAAEVKQFTRGVMGLGSNLLKLAAGGALGAAGGLLVDRI